MTINRDSSSPLPASPGKQVGTYRQQMLRYVGGNCLALLCGLAVAYVALLRGGHISSLTIRTGDFVQYYGISQLILHGHGTAIYDFHRLSHVEAMLVYPLSLQHGVLPYLYPPYFALLVTPLALVPYEAAYAGWLLLNCLSLLLVMFALEQYAGLTGRKALWLRLAALCSLPVIMTLTLGQVSILILALIVGSFFAARSGHGYVAGAALALAMIKPPYVLPFLIVFLVQRRWRAIGAFAGTTLVLVLGAVPVLGFSINQTYGRLLWEVSKWQGQGAQVSFHHVVIPAATYDPHLNDGLAGFAQLMLPGAGSKVLGVGLSLLTLVFLVGGAARVRELEIPFTLAAVTALLINPHVLVHDLTLLIFPVFVSLRFRAGRTPQLGWLLVIGYAMITVSNPVSYALHTQICVLALGAIGVWLYLASSPRRAPGTNDRQPETHHVAGQASTA